MSDGFDTPVCHVTTIGRVTGKPHRIEIWFAHREGTLYLLSGGRDRSDWVRNIVADGSVSVEMNGARFVGFGRVLSPDTAEDRLARRLVFAKYQPGYAGSLERWRESALPVAIDLEPGGTD
ncbi:MAG: nitroreductase family deazaflavin-dependent oxidoreductase [Acidimicrobiia bacterium]|nr:nitroreductase family deazaflavin-dependent oxidoreductase [Acidimicrobiia bacterium]